MVRRAAASNLAKFAHAVEAEAVAHELLPLLIELTNDDQDSVRLLAVEGCGGMARLQPKADLINSILPVVKTYAGDKSWRVRYNVAQQLVNMCEAFGVDTATKVPLLRPPRPAPPAPRRPGAVPATAPRSRSAGAHVPVCATPGR